MSKTSFGNKVYLVGTNAKSAKFAGINVKKTTLCCYMISGILSAVAGLVSLSRLNSAKADFGTSYTMQTILVAVLGGINPDGGFGNIPGIAFAVIILQTLSSYLNQFPAISNYYRDMIWGIALLAVLVFNIYISKRRAKRQHLNKRRYKIMQHGIYYAYWEHEWDGDYHYYIDKVSSLGFDILKLLPGHS